MVKFNFYLSVYFRDVNAHAVKQPIHFFCSLRGRKVKKKKNNNS